jgi:hypothetical protein
MTFKVHRKLVSVPNFIPYGVSFLLSIYVFTRGYDYVTPDAQPQEYLTGLHQLGYAAWGWTLIGCGFAILVGIGLRLARMFWPLILAHTVTGALYATLTSLIIAAGPHPHSGRAWLGAAATSGFHLLRVISLLYEAVTEQAVPHGSR